ncbi:MAG: hypothetical protein WCZ43_13805 [Proteiniphilum sp.]
MSRLFFEGGTLTTVRPLPSSPPHGAPMGPFGCNGGDEGRIGDMRGPGGVPPSAKGSMLLWCDHRRPVNHRAPPAWR